MTTDFCPVAALVGRSADLEVARAFLARSSARLGHTLVVAGEAGVGKSRFVTELRRCPELADRPWLLGQCEPVQEPFLLGPLVGALRHARNLLPPHDQLAPLAGAIAGLLPELDLPPALAPLARPQDERHRIFRAVIEALTAIGPAVLVIDDLHNAAADTADFMSFLLAHLPASLDVVLTLRPEECSRLLIWEALRRHPVERVWRITLSPLENADVAALAADLLKIEPSQAFVDGLMERTAGIPFEVTEVLQTLHVSSARRPDDPGSQAELRPLRSSEALAEIALPVRLRETLGEKLATLDDRARELMQTASVLGTTIDESLLAELTESSEREIARALSVAHRVGLIHTEHNQSRFRHALAREAVYDGLPPPTRKWVHRAAAEELSRKMPVPIAQVVHHYRAASDPRFLDAAEVAADKAVADGHDATAARFLLQAMDADGIPDGQHVRLALKLGRCAVDGLAQSEAIPILERLLVSTELPRSARGELRLLLGRLLRQSGEELSGYEEIERAVPDLVDRPDLHARALAILSAPETVVGRHIDEHRARCAAALRLADEVGDADMHVAVRIAHISLHLDAADPRGWSEMNTLRASEAFAARPREQARAYVNWAQASLRLGYLTHADELLTAARAVVAEVDYARLVVIVDLLTAQVDLAAGRWDGLAERVQELECELDDAFPAALLDAQLITATLQAAQVTAERASSTLSDLIDHAQRVGSVWPLIPARAALANLQLTQYQPEQAVATVATVLTDIRSTGLWAWAGNAVRVAVEANHQLGRGNLAGLILTEWSDALGDIQVPGPRAALLAARAQHQRAQKGPEHGTATLQEARQLWDSLGWRYEWALATARLGLWYAEDNKEADPLLREALTALSGFNAQRDIARVCAAMRQAGVPVPYPWRGGRRSYGQELSPREQQVVELAATGKTNRQIAGDLFLSPRTVESHVGSALRKLGLSSRHELDKQGR